VEPARSASRPAASVFAAGREVALGARSSGGTRWIGRLVGDRARALAYQFPQPPLDKVRGLEFDAAKENLKAEKFEILFIALAYLSLSGGRRALISFGTLAGMH
jgi:hypothetical protein